MGILKNVFGNTTQRLGLTRFKEIGTYTSSFYGFGQDVYQSEIVRSCVRTISEHTSKANAVCKSSKQVEKLLQYRPNQYMNGKDFLAKVRNILEIKNTAFIYISRDDKGKASGFYPIPYSRFECLEYKGNLYIKFYFSQGQETVIHWEDVAVLRKDYYSSDISGDANDSILQTLELINTTNQGIANAVKATSNLRGILKSTKAMLSDEDIKKNKDNFVKDYLTLENEGGIASLDSTQDFTPLSMSPSMANYSQMKEFRENVYRYFGVNDNIIMSSYNEEQLEAFYESRIEPFLVALGLELTNKVFTERERGFGAEIVFESNRMQCVSMNTKLAMVALVDRGALTPNEWRMMLNLSPIDGGDKPIRRLDTAEVDVEQKEPEEQEEAESEEEDETKG